MDGNGVFGTDDGFDDMCLDPDSTSTNTKKDFIAIPFADVIDPAGTPRLTHHSLFCMQSLQAKTLQCRLI